MKEACRRISFNVSEKYPRLNVKTLNFKELWFNFGLGSANSGVQP
jgi:hypothetical protein